MNDHEATIISLKERIGELEQLLEEAYQENKDLEEELNEVTAQVVFFENKIADIDDEIDDIIDRLKTLQKEMND